jgi:hypothetical protein
MIRLGRRCGAAVNQAAAIAQSVADQAASQAQQAVLAEQAKVAQRNAELREAQLQAEVVKPAEA